MTNARETLFDDPTLRQFQVHLLDWYRREKRSLPWRDASDPYAVLVSEVMLQQTQVATVIPYYERFMARFPTVDSLATAPVDDVLRLWQGLGYYSRARNLQRAAQAILERFGGVVPDAVADLLALPGVGRYTAGAVASLGFNRPVPILDGNVTRVLTRLFRVEGNPKTGATHRVLWEIAGALIPDGDARDFNTALMELGSLVCAPSQPQCVDCPVSGVCRARRLNELTRFPELPPSTPTLHVTDVAVLVERDGAVLLTERPKDGVWAGLWELPRVRTAEGESVSDAVRRVTESVCGVRVRVGEPFGIVRHSVTRYRVRLHGFRATWEWGDGEPLSCSSVAWVPLNRLGDYPLASPQRKLLALAFEPETQTRLFRIS
jgi:A/G-specific adenine glycosylase